MRDGIAQALRRVGSEGGDGGQFARLAGGGRKNVSRHTRKG
jgi:hypothetical protein